MGYETGENRTEPLHRVAEVLLTPLLRFEVLSTPRFV